MQAIIPAAGLGTRMLPFSAAAAKELAPIGSKPAIQWTLEEAFVNGISSVVVVISPEKRALKKFLKGNFHPGYMNHKGTREWLDLLEQFSLTIAIQPEPKGLGDALLRGWWKARGKMFYLMYPDNIVLNGEAQFRNLIKPFIVSGLTCVACKEDRPHYKGNHYIVLGEKEGDAYKVNRFTLRDDPVPSPSETFYRAAGRVMVTADYFEIMEKIKSEGVKEELDDIHAYQVLSEQNRILAIPPVTGIHDCGCIEGYSDAWKSFLDGELKDHPKPAD